MTRKTTFYKEASVNPESAGFLAVTRYTESYGFMIKDDGHDQAYIEIGHNQVRRLIKNLTEALTHNGAKL